MFDSIVFNSFKNLNILVLGDVMLDRYLYGSATRISPEAPVPVVHWQHSEDRLGGAANVAMNIKAMGATPYICSVIGNDNNATILENIFVKNNLSTKGLIRSDTRQTTVKERIMASGYQMLRIDYETSHDLSIAENQNLWDSIINLLDSCSIDLILFQDYNKGVLSLPILRSVLEETSKRNIKTSVDPKKNNFLNYHGVTLFKPNLKEIKEALPFDVQPNLVSLKAASEYLRSKLHHQYTMITLSERGVFIDDGKKCQIIPTHPRNIADVSGAGDTVISVASLGIAAGIDIHDVAVLANLAGGLVCEQLGVVPIDVQRLQLEYELIGKK